LHVEHPLQCVGNRGDGVLSSRAAPRDVINIDQAQPTDESSSAQCSATFAPTLIKLAGS
jgi:hypothetical protein